MPYHPADMVATRRPADHRTNTQRQRHCHIMIHTGAYQWCLNYIGLQAFSAGAGHRCYAKVLHDFVGRVGNAQHNATQLTTRNQRLTCRSLPRLPVIPFARLSAAFVLAGWQWTSRFSRARFRRRNQLVNVPVTAFSRSDAAQSNVLDIADSIARTGDFVAGGIHIDHETRRRDANQHQHDQSWVAFLTIVRAMRKRHADSGED